MRPALAIGCVALTLCACAPLDTNVPPSFDLTGHWVLDELASDAPLDLDAIRREEDRLVARGRQTNPGGSAAFVIQDFPILNATRLHIEQDTASMGIRYDQDIYRDVSWGERERDFWIVRTGWQPGSAGAPGALVIRSARGGTKGTEILTLDETGNRLRVTVRVDTEGEDVRAMRVFNRR